MSWHLLQRFFESDVFNSNPFLSVSYLERYADHVGIHYVLCNKLRQFPYQDIEFFLPQICHLVITVNSKSMALEEFLLDLCEGSVIAALLTFWLLQTYLRDLSPNHHAEAFQTCRRVYNKVQHIVFGVSDTIKPEKIQENVLPVTVLASVVMASVALPLLPRWAGPLAVAQARKPRPVEHDPCETPRNFEPQTQSQPPSITRSQTISEGSGLSRRPRERAAGPTVNDAIRTELGSMKPTSLDLPPVSGLPPPVPAARSEHRPAPISTALALTAERHGAQSRLDLSVPDGALSSTSLPLPDIPTPRSGIIRPVTPVTAFAHSTHHRSGSLGLARRHSHNLKTLLKQGAMTHDQKKRLLMQNYFRSETQFLTALQEISNRLVHVPKQARLSALRAELALIAQDLPAEVDIPVICPPTLVKNSPGQSRHHRIVRLNPAEATVLNSAEKVPYLLMVEILRDDFTFDPLSHDNQPLLATLLAERGHTKRIFDLSEAPRTGGGLRHEPEPPPDSVFEPTSGDLGTSPKLTSPETSPSQKFKPKNGVGQTMPARLVSVTSSSSFRSDVGTRRSSTETSESSSPHKKISLTQNSTTPRIEPQDFSALATHMRTASQMLAQLDATSGKRPKHEVAAIRSKIIASMKTLEEKNFDLDDGSHLEIAPPVVSTAIIPALSELHGTNGSTRSGDAGMPRSFAELHADGALEVPPAGTSSVPSANAGEARMQNDFATGGLQRKGGDREDPSAAVFGEAWNAKKERIRKSSPYGWMKNWDLVSVIIKTGSDLRQEAFACQLIKVCHKIWVDAGVNVWVKLMRILVTGESSGLIETITNGVSLHSIKRSLTIWTIESGTNPKRRIVSLKDHFIKAFGPEDGETYKNAVDAFKRSLAAYSIISYVLQLKDRHNGNVLIDNEGHIVHIDFGFMLGISPGGVGFEAAPFKLTLEYVEVLGGQGSEEWEDYKRLCKQAFQALRRSADNIVDLVSMMGRGSKMPCYVAGVAATTNALRQRFQLHLSADEAEQYVETDLIGKSLGSYYTRLYDTFQYRTQGIY